MAVVRIGDVINAKYRLLRLVGDGGMGSVYEAQHDMLGTRVAIKMLHPELAVRTSLVERFLQEARVAAQIKSAHVVQVMDIDRTADGHAYIVMELLQGEPLSTVLGRQHKLSIPTSCEYTRQILLALEAAHALGVIHRDLKPENVFVTFVGSQPVVKLIDFGIAKLRREGQKNLTMAGVLMGTAEYIAPEQARSADQADARSDIYAVGVMLYEMLAGRRPAEGDDGRIVAAKVERGEVEPLVKASPEVPPELAGLVHRAMAPRPEMRFANAAEMRLHLEGFIRGKRPQTGPVQALPYASTAKMEPTAEIVARTSLAGSPDGTLQGAPVDAVMAATAARPAMSAQAPAPQQPVRRGTEVPLGAPAGRHAMAPHGYGGAMTPSGHGSAPYGGRRRASTSTGLWLALILGPLALGGVLGGVYLAYSAGDDSPPRVMDAGDPAPSVVPTAQVDSGPIPALDSGGGSLPSLDNHGQPPYVTPTTHPHDGGMVLPRPPPADAGGNTGPDPLPPWNIPSVFPFPTNIPIPSNLPIPFPMPIPVVPPASSHHAR